MIMNQGYLFLVFSINGILIGLIFDIFRILRKSFKTNDIITYFQDILFWILTGIILLYSIFTFSNGEIRFFMFLGVFLGCLLYMLLFSNSFIKINVKIILFFKKIFTVIISPFKSIFNIIKNIFNKPIKFITINLKKIHFITSIKSLKLQKKKIKTENL